MNADIVREMGRKYPQSRSWLNVKFKTECMQSFKCFYELVFDGTSEFKDFMLANAIYSSSDWGMAENRNVKVRLNIIIWGNKDFLEIVAPGIESIRPVKENPVNDLLTNRKKVRKTKAGMLISKCLTKELVEELADYEMIITGKMTVANGLPYLTFFLESKNNDDCIVIQIDSFTGLISSEGCRYKEMYNGPESFHQFVMETAEKYIEAITA